MSQLILHPIPHSRKVGQYSTPDEVEKARNDFQVVASTAIETMKQYLNDGYTVIDSWSDSHTSYNLRQFLMHKPEDGLKISGKISTVALYAGTPQTGYSKTHSENFDYLACSFGEGQRVNIFDHPDSDRNTWRLCQNKNWTWESIQSALYSSYPVPVTVEYDGEWYKLIDIISQDDYNEMLQFIDNAKDDESEDS